MSVGPRQRFSFLPWVGELPCSYVSLRCVLIGRLRRCEVLGFDVATSPRRLLEDFAELQN